MPQERFPKQALLAKVKGKKSVGRPQTRCADYIEDLGWNRLGFQPSEMLAVLADREVWRLNLELLPRNPQGHDWVLKEEDNYINLQRTLI